jgi:hypothetical protein
VGRRSSLAEILGRSAPPPPTISPIVGPSLEDLSRPPPPPAKAAKARRPPWRITWLTLGLLAGAGVGLGLHDRACATFPRAHAWLLQKGHAVHEYVAPSSPGVVVAVGSAPSARSTASSMPSAAAASASAPPAPASAAAASAAAPSSAPATLRIDELPKAKR